MTAKIAGISESPKIGIGQDPAVLFAGELMVAVRDDVQFLAAGLRAVMESNLELRLLKSKKSRFKT